MSATLLLTDAGLNAMLTRRAGPGAPLDLVEDIEAALAGLPDERRPWWTALAPPARNTPALRLAWVVAIVGLLLAATASAIFVGSELLRRANELSVLPSPPVLPAPSLTVVEGPAATGEPVVMTALPVQINDLGFAPDGTAWAATGFGVVHWDPGGGPATLYDRDDGLPGQRIDLITVGADGTVLISGGDRMAIFDGAWTLAPDLGIVYGMAVGPDGTAWATVPMSLLRYDGTWTRIAMPESVDLIGPLQVGADGRVWASGVAPLGGDPGFGVYDGSSWSTFRPEGVDPARLLSLAGVTPEGTAWMTLPAEGCVWTDSAGVRCDTRPAGVARFDGTRWTVYPLDEVLRGQDTSVVVEDVDLDVGAEGTVWATPDRSGIVARFNGTRWIAAHVPELAAASLLAVAPDGAAWFGSSDGLFRYDGSAVTRYPLPTIDAPREITPDLSPLELDPVSGPTTTPSVLGTITWRVYRVPEGHELGSLSVTHGPVGQDGSVLRWLMPDGSWTGAVLPVGLGGGLQPYGDDLLALDDRTAAARLSWDGSRWVVRDWLELPAALGKSVADIVAGSRGAVATGWEGQVAFSADGMHFSMAARPPEGIVGTVLATRDGFVALVASRDCDGPYGCPGGIHDPLAWFSVDGSTWTLTADTSPFGTSEVLDIASRDGRHVAVGTDTGPDGVWVSDDGIRWERVPGPRGMKVAAGPTGWVMVDEDAQWWASTDGRTWETLDGLPAFARDEWPPHLHLPGGLTAGPGYVVVTGALEAPEGQTPVNAMVIGTIEP